MTTMLFPWIVFGFLLFLGGVCAQKQETSACYGATICNFMQLSCLNSTRIFILNLMYGSKLLNSTCLANPTCPSPCCQSEAPVCLSKYTTDNMASVYTRDGCWNVAACVSQARLGPTSCPGYSSTSSYAVADYNCLSSEDITSFHLTTITTSPAVAIHYDSTDVTNYPVTTGDNRTWHCHVDTADCVQRQADVILVKENYTADNSNNCSSMGWSRGTFLPCFPAFQYLSFNTFTPFRVSVRVGNAGRRPNGWAVVRAQDGANLVVTCGLTDGQLPVSSACSTSRTAALTSSTSQPLLPQGTTVPAPATASSAPVTVSMTTTLTSAQPSAINSDGRASGGELTGAVVAGWVLAVMLAVLLTVLGVLLLRRHGGCSGLMQYLTGKPTSGPPATSRDDNVDVNSLEVIPDPYHVSHRFRRAPTYVNADSRQSTADSEYVNAAADLGRPTSQLEYSPLEWSRDQNTTYSPLNMA